MQRGERASGEETEEKETTEGERDREEKGDLTTREERRRGSDAEVDAGMRRGGKERAVMTKEKTEGRREGAENAGLETKEERRRGDDETGERRKVPSGATPRDGRGVQRITDESEGSRKLEPYHFRLVSMSLLIVLVLFLHVVRALSTDEVLGYLGETVTLPSRADPSWNLSSIEWSILTNTTWIATHRGGATNIDRHRRYKGRLSLNITSGDLTIRNLKKEDDMEYTVNLLGPKREVKVIRLVVNQHLQKPTINTLVTSPARGGCWIALQCSSQDEGVDFSWKTKPPTEDLPNSREIVRFLENPEIDVEFTCTTSRTKENVSSTFTQKFDDTCRPARKRNGRDKSPLCFALGFVIPVVLYSCRDSVRKLE